MRNKEALLVEPVPIEDTLCTGGLVRIEDLGFGARFVLAHRQTCYEDGSELLVVKDKPVLEWRDIWPGLCLTANFMARRGLSFPGVGLISRVPWLHRSPFDRAG